MALRITARVLAPIALLVVACGGDSASPDDPDNGFEGPSGPHFTVSPIDPAKISGITPMGSNGKIFPIAHTYWWTCHQDYLFPAERPCYRERLAIRAPNSGVVFAVEHRADGGITIEGPPGVYAGFAHVTPTAGLGRGTRVSAGDTIARMFTDFAFDFGVVNLRRERHPLLRKERFGDGYLHAENPIAQYPEPLRSTLMGKVVTAADPMGRIAYDAAGTASGAWFRTGTPLTDALAPQHQAAQLFLGRLQELAETPILVTGATWYRAPWGVVVPDAEYPDWTRITPGTGTVWIKLWETGRDGRAMLSSPQGGVLLEVLAGEQMRVEWFDTHVRPPGFTAAAWVYER